MNSFQSVKAQLLAVGTVARYEHGSFAREVESAVDEAIEVITNAEGENEAHAQTIRLLEGAKNDRDEWRERYQRLKIRIQAALGNGTDQEAWKPSERWDAAACRNITENRK